MPINSSHGFYEGSSIKSTWNSAETSRLPTAFLGSGYIRAACPAHWRSRPPVYLLPSEIFISSAPAALLAKAAAMG